MEALDCNSSDHYLCSSFSARTRKVRGVLKGEVTPGGFKVWFRAEGFRGILRRKLPERKYSLADQVDWG